MSCRGSKISLMIADIVLYFISINVQCICLNSSRNMDSERRLILLFISWVIYFFNPLTTTCIIVFNPFHEAIKSLLLGM